MRRLLLLVAVAVLLSAAPGYAQQNEETGREPARETVAATGVIEKPQFTAYAYGTHSITDEATGKTYALTSEEGLLDRYTGQRVTLHGAPAPGYEGGAVEGGPPLLNVTRVEPTGSAGPGGPRGGSGTGNISGESSGSGSDQVASPGDGVDVNGDGAVNEADGEFAARISDAAKDQTSGQKTLPKTGGLPPGAGLLVLAAVGLLVLRAIR